MAFNKVYFRLFYPIVRPSIRVQTLNEGASRAAQIAPMCGSISQCDLRPLSYSFPIIFFLFLFFSSILNVRRTRTSHFCYFLTVHAPVRLTTHTSTHRSERESQTNKEILKIYIYRLVLFIFIISILLLVDF